MPLWGYNASWRLGANRVTSKRKSADLDLRDTPGHLLRRCQQRSQEIFREVLGEFGLTQQQTALLLTLARSSTASIQDLSDSSGTDRNTLSEVTTRLIRRGLIVEPPAFVAKWLNALTERLTQRFVMQ